MKFKKRKRPGLSTKVYIVTPVMLNFQIDIFVAQFCQAAIMRGIADWETMPSRTAEDARNRIMQDVMKNKPQYTHFFFLDADSFPYDAYMIERLLAHNKDVVAGPTPTQRKPHTVVTYDVSGKGSVNRSKIRRLWNVVTQDENGNPKSIKRNEDNPELDELPKTMFKAIHVGCTGLLVKREVIAKLAEPYQYTHRNEKGHVTLSEDYDFCKKIIGAGYDIWVDPELKSGHRQTLDIGNY